MIDQAPAARIADSENIKSAGGSAGKGDRSQQAAANGFAELLAGFEPAGGGAASSAAALREKRGRGDSGRTASRSEPVRDPEPARPAGRPKRGASRSSGGGSAPEPRVEDGEDDRRASAGTTRPEDADAMVAALAAGEASEGFVDDLPEQDSDGFDISRLEQELSAIGLLDGNPLPFDPEGAALPDAVQDGAAGADLDPIEKFLQGFSGLQARTLEPWAGGGDAAAAGLDAPEGLESRLQSALAPLQDGLEPAAAAILPEGLEKDSAVDAEVGLPLQETGADPAAWLESGFNGWLEERGAGKQPDAKEMQAAAERPGSTSSAPASSAPAPAAAAIRQALEAARPAETRLQSALQEAPEKPAEPAARLEAQLVLEAPRGPAAPDAGEGKIPAAQSSGEVTLGPGYEEFERQVSRLILNRLRQGESQMRITLKPPHLGAMQVQMTLRGASLGLSFKVESRSARNLLTSGAPELQRALSEKGVDMDGFQVEMIGEEEAWNGGGGAAGGLADGAGDSPAGDDLPAEETRAFARGGSTAGLSRGPGPDERSAASPEAANYIDMRI